MEEALAAGQWLPLFESNQTVIVQQLDDDLFC
jgi:hypothetical protein